MVDAPSPDLLQAGMDPRSDARECIGMDVEDLYDLAVLSVTRPPFDRKDVFLQSTLDDVMYLDLFRCCVYSPNHYSHRLLPIQMQPWLQRFASMSLRPKCSKGKR